MAHVELILVPYDSGHEDARMGRGPDHILESGMADRLGEDGHAVTITRVSSRLELPAEIAVAFDLARSIAGAVRQAREAGRLPFVLAGNCFSAVGTMAGLGPDRTGVLWLDAHGDLNTPETTRSGMLDGMALATLTGRCWRGLTTTVPGFVPIPDQRLVLVGARDMDTAEETLTAALGLRRLGPAELAEPRDTETVRALLERMSEGLDQFYLHVDLDVLDPDAATVNEFGARGGLRVDDVNALATEAARAAGIGAAAFTALDPAFDVDGRAARAAIEIARSIARG